MRPSCNFTMIRVIEVFNTTTIGYFTLLQTTIMKYTPINKGKENE